MKTLFALITEALKLNRWFVVESRKFIGPYTWRSRLRWPAAWCRFMWYSLKDWKPLPVLLITAALLCSCAKDPYPVLRVRDYDPMNNRVEEKGQLLPWTNWAAGVKIGTNWVELIRAEEK